MTRVTDEQKREAALIVSLGCDLETAAKYVGATLRELWDEAESDTEFAGSLRRAEAGAELAHMRNVQQAARDVKQWRASVWWLERRAPERYARRDDAVGRRELLGLLGAVANAVADAVRDDADRRRVLDRLSELAESLVDPWQERTEAEAPQEEEENPDA